MTREKLVELAIGRILRLGSRPFQEGDLEEFDRCRAIILDNTDPVTRSYEHNYARDRNRGAQGD